MTGYLVLMTGSLVLMTGSLVLMTGSLHRAEVKCNSLSSTSV